MIFARKWMRLLVLSLLVVTLALGLSVCANAEYDPIEFTIEVMPDSLTAPGAVNVSLKVANTGSTDMISPVTLYDPDGNVVPSFGDGGSYVLAAGAFRTWEGTWNVTQAQLDQGKVTYTVKYHLEDENGEMVAMTTEASAPVTFTGEKVELSVTRTISPEIVRSGSSASVLYELYNSGNVELTSLRLEEKISKKAQTAESLKPGEKITMTFTSKIGNADLTSAATITYKVKGDSKTQKKQVEEAVIPLAKPNLTIELSSPTTGVNIGETAELVVTFVNAGNVSYSNVSVEDSNKGQFLTNLSIPAGATVSEKVEFILMEKTEFKVTATLPDNTGVTNHITAKPLTVNVFDPEKTLLLTLNLTCDHETVEKAPADVRFMLNVTNNSNVKAEKITILHGDKTITTIPELEPGASINITRDVRISQAGKFRFTASVKDAMNNTVTFDSNTLQLSYAPAVPIYTAVPRATVAPPEYVTPVPATPMLGSIRDVLKNVSAVLGALLAVGLVLFAVSTAIRAAKKNKSNAAYDHLELSERRDYNEPAGNADDYDSDSVPKAAVQKETALHAELPHEKLIKAAAEKPEDSKAEARPEKAEETKESVIAETPKKETKPEKTAEFAAIAKHRNAEKPDEEGGYHISRAALKPHSAPNAEPVPTPAQAKEAQPAAAKPEDSQSEAVKPETENKKLEDLIKPRQRTMIPKKRHSDKA